jgi:hypothetical protein
MEGFDNRRKKAYHPSDLRPQRTSHVKGAYHAPI